MQVLMSKPLPPCRIDSSLLALQEGTTHASNCVRICRRTDAAVKDLDGWAADLEKTPRRGPGLPALGCTLGGSGCSLRGARDSAGSRQRSGLHRGAAAARGSAGTATAAAAAAPSLAARALRRGGLAKASRFAGRSLQELAPRWRGAFEPHSE